MHEPVRPTPGARLSRRDFLAAASAAVVLPALGGRAAEAAAPAADGVLVGACRGWGNHALLKAAGYAYVEESVSGLFVPDKPEAEFDKIREQFKASSLPVRACNGFFPGGHKLVGPEAKHDQALAWAAIATKRAQALGVPIIVLGSGGARKVPDGFERAKALEQFVAFLKRLGPIAGDQGVTVAIEPLNRGETNFLNTLAQVAEAVDAAGHPAIQATADFYHMARENEGADAVAKAGARIRHGHIAEKETRTAPGAKGDDFRPYFKALKALGYRGGISMECKWGTFEDEAAKARETVSRQWADA